MDLDRVLKRSRKFYRNHGLADWADLLSSESMTPAEGSEDILAEAEKLGFKSAFAFPRFAQQFETIGRLVEETARKHAAELIDTQQYSEPFLSDTWSKTANGKILQRTDNLWTREEGPYVLLFERRPCPAMWGRTGAQIIEYFEGKGWTGLTVPEYLVLQRYFCEKEGDHRFFKEPLDDTNTHWLWLTDSCDGTSMSVVQGNARGINIQAPKATNRDSRRAAIATLVLPLHT